jgi:putative transposase
MAAEGSSIELACRVLKVSASGYYAQRGRPPSARAVRHAYLTEVIRGVHLDSRGTYGARRVHAELILGHGLVIGRCVVELLMSRAGIAGLSGRPRYRRVPHLATAGDLVDRQFRREQPDRLWVTDITEHPTREGKVYCAVVLDVFSRRVVGWSIDESCGDRRARHERLGHGHRAAWTRRDRDPFRSGHRSSRPGRSLAVRSTLA